jgi:hypothetical protein
MTVHIRVGTTIRRSRRKVAGVLYDPRYDAEWMETLQEPAYDDGGPLVVGRHLERSLRLPMGWVELDMSVTEHQREKRVAIEATANIPVRILLDLDGIPEGTIAWIEIEAQFSGFRRLLGPAIRLFWRKALLGDLARLKALIESNGHRELAAAAIIEAG